MDPVFPISSLEQVGFFIGVRGWAGKYSSLLGRLSVDQQWNVVVFNGVCINHHFFDIDCIGQIKHGVDEGLLQNRTQTACTCFACQGFLGNGVQGFGSDFQVNAFHVEQLAKLFDQGVFGFRQNLNQGLFCEFGQGGHHRHTAYQFGDEAKLD